MHRSIATVSLSGSLRQKLEAVSAAGFDGIELFENDFINFRGTATDLRTLCADLGLSIDLYQPFRDVEGMPEPQFRRSLERADRKFDLMKELGASLMLVCSNTSPLALPGHALAAEQLHALADKAARRGIRIGFEALAWGRHVNLYGQAWSIVEQANHPNLGLILDSFHTLSLKDDPSGIASIPGDKIFFLQMADAPLLGMDVLQWARHYRNFPGQGQFDVANFLEQVLRAGYTGPLSLEIFNDIFRSAPTRRTATDAMRSLLCLEDQVRCRLSGSGKPPVLPHVVLFEAPAVPALEAISYIEFAVDEASAAALTGMLRKLGFRHAGLHRSKQVSLFRQGGINLVVNAEPGSDARERFDRYGSSVCALGLVSSAPVQSAARAEAMCSVRCDSSIGPAELQIPGIRVPGGMVFNFMPAAMPGTDVYATDFVLAPDADLDASEVDLLAIDHVALALESDELDTWTLFARAVLGLTPGDSHELADPHGLIRSSSMQNDERGVRLVLNVASSPKTRAGQTVAITGGGSVHHLAFAAADIFASVALLRKNGVAFVPISANYYDDLATRHDLDASLLDRLREYGVLFDRLPSGDFFHIYTEPFKQRFFFEIVQRVAAYDSYGVSNASARLASQEQGAAAPS
jgi:4-hydroxyphenylpyruvate dioxygenase